MRILHAFLILYPAVFHVQHPVAHLCEFFIVRDDEEGLSEFFSQPEEQLMEFFGIGRVEVAGGFVGENDLRLVDQCPGYRDALLLTAGKRSGFVIHPVRQSQHLQE